MSLETLRPDLDRILATAQAEQRLPSVTAAVFCDGEVVWESALGLADVGTGTPTTVDHAYRIGSITKTFTAVAVMQLRDEGLIELDDPLSSVIPEAPAATFRQALSHTAGLQREPPGDIWQTLALPGRDALVRGLAEAETVLPAGDRFHYSNLVFALLGEAVARVRASTYERVLRERILDPLGLRRTRLEPEPPVASGYYVHPWSDEAIREADLAPADSTNALGLLWSTVGDLARWGDFLCAGNEAVLAKETLDEMARLQVMIDLESWTVGWGLGLTLIRRGDRVLAGHGGAMPGFLAGLTTVRAERTGAAVLIGTGAGAEPEALAIDLAAAAADALPRTPEAWRPEEPPRALEPLLGSWWIEGSEIVLAVRGGRLQARLLEGPPGREVSFFEEEAPDRWRCVDGREHGELLLVRRDPQGCVAALSFATYLMTRRPTVFTALPTTRSSE